MRRALFCAVLAFLTVELQVMFVDGLPLPGASVPDAALLVVVALGLIQGPATGMLTGFFAGLGLDLAPPASHLVGESALVFCLVGYGCGLLGNWLDRSALRLLAAAMIGAGAGETLRAAIGVSLGDPRVTLPAVRHVLPAAVAYDVLLTPVVLGLTALASRRPGARRPGAALAGMDSGPHRLPARPVRLRPRALRTSQPRAPRASQPRAPRTSQRRAGAFRRLARTGRRVPRPNRRRPAVRRDRARTDLKATVARPPRWRLAGLFAACVILPVILASRLWYLQVMTGSDYLSLARKEQIRTVVVPAVRGQILDDTGRALVANRSSLAVTVNMTELSRQGDGGSAELRRLAALLGVSDRLLRERLRLCTVGVSQPCWAGSPYQPVPVSQDVPERVGVQIMESRRQLPGVTVQVQSVTSYPGGASAAQILGYLQPATAQEERQRHLPPAGPAGADLVGQSGLEARYDAALRGVYGIRDVAVNAAGNVTGTFMATRPVSGDDLVTSISAPVQADVEHALAHAVRTAHAEGNLGATTGAAVVMTTGGRVIAMASYPSYDPGIWTRGISERQYRRLFDAAGGEPILNRAAQGEYAPGSTWKVTSTAAAVSAGYSLAGPYNCPGSVNIGGRTFFNDNPSDSGAMSLHAALVASCDTVFYELAYDMWLRDDRKANVVTSARAPVQKMQKMELAWGFGKVTGIDLPEESAGTVPTRAWLYRYYRQNKKLWCANGNQFGSYVQRIEYQDCRYGNVWEPGQAVDAAIGQGYVTVTPLQLARAYAALANGGTLYSPRIGAALIRPDGVLARRITPPVVGHLPVSTPVLAYIRNALADAVTQGTAAPAFSGFPQSKVCVAGKTGTAQVAGKDATSVFASYAPCAHPRYVVVMMVPASGYGADVSAPAVRQIWDGIYGLEGHRAALPGGLVPSGVPRPAASGPAFPAAGRTG